MDKKEPYDSTDPQGWTGIRRGTYSLEPPVFHHYAEKVVAFDPEIKEGIEQAVSLMTDVVCFRRGRQQTSKGIDPDQLNKHLRDKLQAVSPEWSFETSLRDGVLYDHGNYVGAAVGGFDISRYDVLENLVRLRNLCYGRRPLRHGDEHWTEELSKRPRWAQVANEVDWDREYPPGEDHQVKASRPTILGELQFGNWGLAYRDYLKVVAADQHIDIDCFLYLVPTGNLQRHLSSGIVTFTNSIRYLRGVADAVKVPIVIWGIDVEVDSSPEGWQGPLSADMISLIQSRVGKKRQ